MSEGAYARHLARQQGDPARSLEGYAVWFDAALGPGRGLALDFGAGLGEGIDYLATRGFGPLESFDVELELSAALASRVEAAHTASDPRAWLATQRGRFALILAKDVLEHLPHEETVPVTQALLAALAPGGRLVVSVPHAVGFAGIYARYGDFTHRTAFTESSLRFVLEAAGARAVTLHPPRFQLRLSPKTLVYRGLKRVWHTALKGLYALEDPASVPTHCHPRLVASATRA